MTETTSLSAGPNDPSIAVEILGDNPPPIEINGSDQTRNSRVWRFSDVVIILLGIGLLFIALLGIGLVLTKFIGGNGTLLDKPSLAVSLMLGLIEALALLIGVYVFGLRRRKYGWEAVWVYPLSKKWLIISLIFGLLAIPLSSLIASLVQLIFNLPPVNPQLEFLIPDGFSWTGFIGMLLIGGLIIPFTEELLFRGVFYLYFGQKWGVWVGIIISALIFGLAHGDIAISSAAFVLGIMLAWLYQKSHSLWAPVLVHVINNGVKIALIYILAAAGVDISNL